MRLCLKQLFHPRNLLLAVGVAAWVDTASRYPGSPCERYLFIPTCVPFHVEALAGGMLAGIWLWLWRTERELDREEKERDKNP